MDKLRNGWQTLTGRVPLRVVLTVPFIVQMVGIVVIVGYMSYRNGEAALQEVTTQLRAEVSQRIYDRLLNYLEAPQVINAINYELIRSGRVDLTNTSSLTQLFWQQKSLFEHINVSAIYFGSETGEFFGMGFQESQRWEIGRAGVSTGNRFFSFAVDDQGNPTDILNEGDPYDPRVRPWYERAESRAAPAWSDVYIDFKEPRLKLTHARPVYAEDGELLGVVGVDFVLSHIQEFLQELSISPKGEMFILERTGLLVASSGEEEPFLRDWAGQVSTRLAGQESAKPLVRETTTYLHQTLGDLHRVTDTRQLTFEINGERQFLQVTPLRDPQGIDWLIVVVVPESDFMAPIYRNTRITIWVSAVALMIALGGGIATTRWVIQPILTLNQAAKAFAKGQWKRALPVRRRDELGELAQAFNQMAFQIRTYLSALENQNALMTEVNNRLKASLEAESKLNQAAERFVPNQFLHLLGHQSIVEVELGDAVCQEMSVLFCDIRNFTTLSERMGPEDNFKFINAFLSRMEPPILRHRGFIDKYIGDAIMALFGDTADDAVRGGIAMLEALAQYNTTRKRPNRPPIQVGIGINTGELILGMVGGKNRMDGTVISDAVNLAARVEALTKHYQVPMLITEHTYGRLQSPESFYLRTIGQVTPHGKTKEVTIVEVFDTDPTPLRQAKLDTRATLEKGVKLQAENRWEEAIACFGECVQHAPEDTVAQYYLRTAQNCLNPNWIPLHQDAG